MALEDLERTLYSKQSEEDEPTSEKKKPTPISAASVAPAPSDVPHAWQEIERAGGVRLEDEEPEEKGMPFMKKLLLFSIGGFAVILVGVITFLFLSGNTKSQNVDVTVYAPTGISRGVPFDVTVNVSNNADLPLRNAVLNINLPTGVVNMNEFNGAGSVISESVGDVGGGEVVANKKFKLLPIGDPNSLQHISVKLVYSIEGSSRFEKEVVKEVKIQDPGISVEATKPDQILQGSNFTFEIRYKNVTDYDFPQLTLQAKYPGAFKFVSASLTPDSLNNYWRLGQLNSGSEGTLEIKGRLEGLEEMRFGIPVTLSVNFLGKDYPIADYVVNIALAPSPIQLQLLVNGQDSYVARIGDDLNYTIRYQNMSGIALADAVISASFAGELLDTSTFATKGSLDTRTNAVTWNASNVPELRLLEPGASGQVSVQVKLKSIFPIRRTNDKNYTIKMQAHMDSPSVPYYMKADKTSALASVETKVGGLMVVDTKVYYRDPAASIANQGAFPPHVNQPTEYTVHWIVRNYATDAKDISIQANLQSGVEWTNVVKTNGDTSPLYNDRTKEVTWNIGRVPATKGIIGDPLEVVFQIRATPNNTQLGLQQPLIGPTTLQATDEFTGGSLASQDAGVTTDLPDDPTVGQAGGKVQP